MGHWSLVILAAHVTDAYAGQHEESSPERNILGWDGVMGCLLQLLGGVLVGLSLFAFLFGFWPGLILLLLGLWLALTGQRVIAARRFEQKMLRYYDELTELARQEVEAQRQLLSQQSSSPRLRLKRVSWWRRLFHRGELIGEEKGQSEEWES